MTHRLLLTQNSPIWFAKLGKNLAQPWRCFPPFQKHGFRQIARVTNGSMTFLTNLEDAEVTEILDWNAEGLNFFSRK
jgi:hypothetical protein